MDLIPDDGIVVSGGMVASAGMVEGSIMGRVEGIGMASMAQKEEPKVEAVFPMPAKMAMGALPNNNMNYIMLGGIALVIILLLRK